MLAEHLDLASFVTFTTLREPWNHLISHLAWIRRLTEPEFRPKFERRTKTVQQLAQKLTAADLTSASALEQLASPEYGQESEQHEP